MKNESKIIIVFLGVIIVILLGLFFKNNLLKLWNIYQVKSHASVYNFTPVAEACAEETNNKEKCDFYISTYTKIKEQDDREIDKVNGDINCSNFSTAYGARTFFEYSGGPNLYKQLNYINANSSKYVYDSSDKDPFGLDENKDGNPCEKLRDNNFQVDLMNETDNPDGTSNPLIYFEYLKDLKLFTLHLK